MATSPAGNAGSVTIGGTTSVRRLGFGAMRITGAGVWGDPPDPDEAVRVLRRAVDLGVNFIDTADSYGPFVSEQLIRRALHPYPADLVIATKAGLARGGPDVWSPVGRPEYLRQQALLSLRHLGVERIELFQLHRIDPQVPIADQIGALADLQREGLIHHIGVSDVDLKQLRKAQKTARIVSVQNHYNLNHRGSDDVVDHAQQEGITFIPWYPLGEGRLSSGSGVLADVAAETGASHSQIALAWLLRRSPAMLPIPGTSRLDHLEANVAAASVTLSDDQFRRLSAVSRR